LTYTEVVTAKDAHGNDMSIYVTKPYTLKDKTNLPCLIFNHGGGAVLFSAEISHWYGLDKRFALMLDCTVVMPEFRNAPEIK